MTVQELMIKARDILQAHGYDVTSTDDYRYQARAIKDGKAWYTPVKGYSFTRLNGHTISLIVVNRHNGTDNNISVDVNITEWSDNSGRQIAKERVNTNMSDKVINNRVDKVMAIYESI